MRQFPFLNEPDIVKAGISCLKMIANFYGDSVLSSTIDLGNNLKINRLSLLGIVQMAESIGFDTLSTRVTFEDLKYKAPMPCIIHWQAKHFIVVYKINKNYVLVADPKLGKTKYSYDEFIKNWYSSGDNSHTGIVLLLEPGTRFFHRVNNDKVREIYENKERHKLRRSIVELPASPRCHTGTIKAHILLGKGQVEMTICTCKALNVVIGAPVFYVFHDDGSLTKKNIVKLSTQFPGCVIIERSIADKIASEKLKDYPMCKFVRENNILMLKLFDVLFWSDNDARVGYIDSDILFIRKPEQYVNELKNVNGNNLFNKDIDYGCFYTLTLDEMESIINTIVIPQINAGLWVLDRSVINFDLIEEWLSSDLIQSKLSDSFLEQTIMAMLASVHHKQGIYFSEEYDVCLNNEVKNVVCRHYVGPIRKDYELEGLKFLLKDLNFARRWKRFVKECNASQLN